MAKLVEEEFELELKFCRIEDYGDWKETVFSLEFFVNGKPAINKEILKADKFFCSFLNEEKYNPITTFKNAINNQKVFIWEAVPDDEMSISIYPDRLFPNLNKKFENTYTIIFCPNVYSGISFILCPHKKEFVKFVQDLEVEYNELIKLYNG